MLKAIKGWLKAQLPGALLSFHFKDGFYEKNENLKVSAIIAIWTQSLLHPTECLQKKIKKVKKREMVTIVCKH